GALSPLEGQCFFAERTPRIVCAAWRILWAQRGGSGGGQSGQPRAAGAGLRKRDSSSLTLSGLYSTSGPTALVLPGGRDRPAPYTLLTLNSAGFCRAPARPARKACESPRYSPPPGL